MMIRVIKSEAEGEGGGFLPFIFFIFYFFFALYLSTPLLLTHNFLQPLQD
jgi:hypothetical protein